MLLKRSIVVLICACFVLTAANRVSAVDRPVQLSVGVSAEYTDNRDASEAEEQDNLDIAVTPRADAIVGTERSRLDFFYAPSLRWRDDPREGEDDSDVFHQLGLNIDHQRVPRENYRIRESFTFTDDSTVQEGTDIRRDESYYLNKAEVGLTYEVSRRSFADLQARHMMKRYDEADVGDVGDEDRLEGGLTLRRNMDRTMGYMLLLNAASTSYDDDLGLDRDFDSLSVGLGFDKVLGSSMRIGAGVGWMTLDYDDAAIDGEDSPFGSIQIEVTTMPSALFSFEASYVIRDADVYPYSSQEFFDLTASVRWDASPKLTLDASGAYRVGDYDADTVPADAADRDQAVDGEETTVIAACGIAYRLRSTTSIRLAQRYEDVDSDVASSSTRNSTRLSLSQRF